MKPNSNKLNWYVVYTYPRSERKASKKLQEMGTTSFLPLQQVIRQWNDRKKKLEIPLFPCYLFVYVSALERFNVLKIKELVRFISFGGTPAVVSDTTIDSLKKIVKGENIEVSGYDNYPTGTRVSILKGQFAGLEGLLLRRRGKNRLVLEIPALQRSVVVDVPSIYVGPAIQ